MIELLPEEAKTEHRLVSKLLVICLLILVWGSSFYLHNLIVDWQQKSKQLAVTIKDLVKQKKELLTKIKQGQKYRQVTARANLANYARLVKDLKLIIPKQVWLTEFKVNAEQKVVFSGETKDNNQIITVIQRIMKYPYFTQVELAAKDPKQERISFRLVGSIKNE